MHEASLHKRNVFATLTYDDAHLPKRLELQYSDFQRFMKRLRKEFAPERVRFYMCGEYGPLHGRPHFHACLFGVDFEDRKYYQTTGSGMKLYTSETLGRIWPCGFSSLGAVNFESAGYVARYCVQKITGFNAKYHYARKDEEGEYTLTPEFNKMSLKPGIGAGFLQKWETDIYPHDYVIINGKEVKPPKYYDKLMKQKDPLVFEDLQYLREQKGRENYLDNTPERLAVKEQVQQARVKFLRRSIE